MNLTPKHIHILRHSLGLDENGHGNQYRNYYCSGYDCDGHPDIEELVHAGLMELGRVDGNNRFYRVTDKGRDAALKDVVYPVLTRSQKRYQRFLDADSGMRFGEWLKTKWAE